MSFALLSRRVASLRPPLAERRRPRQRMGAGCDSGACFAPCRDCNHLPPYRAFSAFPASEDARALNSVLTFAYAVSPAVSERLDAHRGWHRARPLRGAERPPRAKARR